MKLSTIDPMTGNEVLDPGHALFIVEGQGEGAIGICFESQQTREAYLEFCREAFAAPPIDAYNKIAGNEITGTIN